VAKIAASSTEFLIINGIKPFDPDSPDALVDITTLDVFVAVVEHVVPLVEPESGDWVAAEWVNPRKVRIKIGPDGGAITRTEGEYDVWLRIDGTAESPKRKVGMLAVNPDTL